jgi:hypothetical protein
MFMRFDESARMVVVTAQEEARALRHPAIGGEDLLLGIAKEEPVSVNLAVGAVREHVIARFGTGRTPSPEQMPFTAGAQRGSRRQRTRTTRPPMRDGAHPSLHPWEAVASGSLSPSMQGDSGA